MLAFESDLLEYDDLFTGSVVVAAKVEELVAGAREEMANIEAMGGAVPAVESGYMKSALVASHALRRQRIEAGEDIVVGVNRFETTEPNPLTADLDTAIQTVSTNRAALGATQNQFEHTINNLNVAVENLSASESRIRDTDMASEMVSFTRSQILSQAGTSMLSQATQAPQSVLKLLG